MALEKWEPTTITQASQRVATSRRGLRTIQETDFKVRVKSSRLAEELTNSFKRQVYIDSRAKDSVSEEQKAIIAKLANWLSVDNTDRHKWLMFIGGVGNGKTTMMKAMHYLIEWLNTTDNGAYRDAIRWSYRYITAVDLFNLYKNDNAEYERVLRTKLVFLDDLGAEPMEQNNFGTKSHPIKDFLLYRYDKRLPLVMTTNIPLPKEGEESQFKLRYTLQVSDRLNGECTKIKFFNKSFR